MPLINLITDQRAQIRQREGQIRALGWASLLVILCAGLACLVMVVSVGQMALDRMYVQDQIRKLEPIRQQVETNKTLIADLEPRIQTLGDATEATQRWNRILEYLTTNTPPQMRLSGVTAVVGQPSDPIKISVKGFSSSNAEVSEFLFRLLKCPDLESVQFAYTREQQGDRGRRLEFEITANIKGSAPPPPDTDADATDTTEGEKA